MELPIEFEDIIEVKEEYFDEDEPTDRAQGGKPNNQFTTNNFARTAEGIFQDELYGQNAQIQTTIRGHNHYQKLDKTCLTPREKKILVKSGSLEQMRMPLRVKSSLKS